MANTAVATRNENKVSFSMKMNSNGFQNAIKNTLQDPKRCARFTAAITSAVSNQPALQECDASTILSAALLGESLNLSPSPQLGQYYLVPFKDRKNNRTTATFVLGYKGYIQLALRSGYYKKLNVIEIKEGELKAYDPLNEVIEVEIIQDDAVRSAKKTIGYYAFFEYMNGFQKMLYWSREKMESHALQYSMGYKAKKGYTFWEKDFDGMAKKTMLRQLISKWGVMSVELETALRNDDAAVNQTDDGYFEPDTPSYDMGGYQTGIEGTETVESSDDATPVEFETVEHDDMPMPAEFEQVSLDEL